MSAKAVLRKQIREILAALPEERIERESGEILRILKDLPEVKRAGSVFCYASMPKEVRTDGLIRELLGMKKEVYLPRVINESEMEFVRIRSLEELRERGPYGIREPMGERTEITPELFLIPGMAFDRKGNRLGHGKGYYDRYLKDLKGRCTLAGLSLACQLLPRVPAEENDIPMDLVLSADGVSGGSKGE